MKTGTYHILRVGTGITFLWIGILIFRNPTSWGAMLQPWAYNLLPGSLESAMIGTAILDVVIGILMLIDVWTWIAGLVGALHMAIILTTVGIDDITVRDISILTACLAIMWPALPEKIRQRFSK